MELRYRIQVRNRYTYRDSSNAMERLVQDLIDGPRPRIDSMLAEFSTGRKAVEPELVKPEEITITVEVAPKPEEEEWHEMPVRGRKMQAKKTQVNNLPKLTLQARKEWRKQPKKSN
jgi:hypothetical protein